MKIHLQLKNIFHQFFIKSNQTIMSIKEKLLPTTKSNDTIKSKPSIILVALNLFHRFVMLCVRFCLIKIHGEHGPSMPPIEDLILLESATAIAEKIRTKKLSSVSVMNSFIVRIKQVNPLLNCVVDNRFEEALKDAAAADKLIASGQYTIDELREKKPFLGVPISTKDCIEVKGKRPIDSLVF